MTFVVRPQGIVRRSNPTVAIDGTPSDISVDDLGRQVMKIHQVRDLIFTAAATLSTGTKTVLATSTTGTFSDLLSITASNDSDVAAVLTLFDEATTMATIPIAANSVTVLNYIVPLPQSAAGAPWFVDLSDITGTTIRVNALFSREI